MKHTLSLALMSDIEQSYAIFSKYRINKITSIDDFYLSNTDKKSLIDTPLHQLTCHQMISYISEISDIPPPIDELRYFLPRILELVAHRQVVYISEELSLVHFHFDNTQFWCEKERQFLQSFAQTFIQDELQRDDITLVSAIHWVICFGLGGLKISPLLKVWEDNAEHLSAIWHFWELINGIFITDDDTFYCNYTANHPTFNQEMTYWLNDKKVLQKFYHAVEYQLTHKSAFNAGELYHLQSLYAILAKKLQ